MGRKGKKHKDKRRQPTTCVYCGNTRICTEEHVIPQCFFSEENMPLKSDFVIVPVCDPCNSRKARDDSYVRDLFTADIACDGNPTVRAVLPTVFRSIKKNWSDFGRVAISQGHIKAMHSPGGIYLGHYPSVPVEWKRVNRFFRMVARGLYWKKFEKRFPDGYTFEVRRLYASAFSDLFRHVMENGGNGPHAIGEGVFGCAFMMAEEDPFITYWLMWIYESIFITVATGPHHYFDQFVRPNNEPGAIGLW